MKWLISQKTCSGSADLEKYAPHKPESRGLPQGNKADQDQGAGSKLPWLLATNRMKQNMDMVDNLEPLGEAGKDCFEQEFKHCSRTLQTTQHVCTRGST